jgi:hypothetical protein
LPFLASQEHAGSIPLAIEKPGENGREDGGVEPLEEFGFDNGFKQANRIKTGNMKYEFITCSF